MALERAPWPIVAGVSTAALGVVRAVLPGLFAAEIARSQTAHLGAEIVGITAIQPLLRGITDLPQLLVPVLSLAPVAPRRVGFLPVQTQQAEQSRRRGPASSQAETPPRPAIESPAVYTSLLRMVPPSSAPERCRASSPLCRLLDDSTIGVRMHRGGPAWGSSPIATLGMLRDRLRSFMRRS
jgi:hypothetical protein